METTHRPAPASGFTLVELLIAMTVATILLVVAVPAFRSVTMGNRLTTQANDVVAAINLARSEAIKRNATIAFCRADSDSATACAGNAGDWEHWIVSTPANTVVRRGSISTYGGTIIIQSTLNNDRAAFGADGLTRTGVGLANDHEIILCSTNNIPGNQRRIVMGAGSRLSTLVESEEC